MDNQPMSAKTPDVLLLEQNELLRAANKYHHSILESQLKNIEAQADLLILLIEEQRKQTSHLKVISLAATIFIILAILGACIGCIGLYNFVKMSLPSFLF